MISSSQIPQPDNTRQSHQTSMPPMGLKPTISAVERPQTYVVDRAATWTGIIIIIIMEIYNYPEYTLLQNVFSSVWATTHHLSCLIFALGYPQYPQLNARFVTSNKIAPILSRMPSCLRQSITLQIHFSFNRRTSYNTV